MVKTLRISARLSIVTKNELKSELLQLTKFVDLQTFPSLKKRYLVIMQNCAQTKKLLLLRQDFAGHLKFSLKRFCTVFCP